MHQFLGREAARRRVITEEFMTVLTDQAAGRPAIVRIPALIKRNITLFALSQSFTGAGMSFAYGLGPLMVIGLTGSASLAGLSVSLIGLSRFLASYPIGKITDTYGRKPGILLGLVLALAGSILLGLSLTFIASACLLAGLLVFAMGMNAAQQLRVAATDMFLPHMRGRALGYIAMGSMAGLVISPLVVFGSERFADSVAINPLSLPWFVLPLLIIVGHVADRLHPSGPEGNRAKSSPLLRGLCAAAAAPRRRSLDLQCHVAFPASPDKACHRCQLRRPGQHVDRHGADLAGARAITATASAPLPPRTPSTPRECSPSRFRWENSPTASATAR